jgi:hypothetical protein
MLAVLPHQNRVAYVHVTCHFIRRFFIFQPGNPISPGRKAGMALVGHADANRHALLNTTKLPVYSTCRLCQQTPTFNLLAVVQG